MNEIRHEADRFYIEDEKKEILAEIDFEHLGVKQIVISHTFVSPSLRGQGIGQQLVDKVVELARKEKRTIVPQCSFARKVLEGNTAYEDVLDYGSC